MAVGARAAVLSRGLVLLVLGAYRAWACTPTVSSVLLQQWEISALT